MPDALSYLLRSAKKWITTCYADRLLVNLAETPLLKGPYFPLPPFLGLGIQERIKDELLMICHTPYTPLLHQLLKDGYRLHLSCLNQNLLQELDVLGINRS
ncbi:MAG: hypothetical protein QXP81_04670 [Nitrososphaerota archaeon]|nr:hypothetical protein [Candidatus Calditenuis fumarioli]